MAAELLGWQWALIGIAAAIVLLVAARIAVQLWARKTYRAMLESPRTRCDVDAFVDAARNPVNATKVVLMTKALSLGNRTASVEPIPLEVVPSPTVPGLLVTRKLSSGGGGASAANAATPLEQVLQECDKSQTPPIVVATIRMGFGHHRLAYSACSWALQKSQQEGGGTRKVIFHDLLSISSPEADLIKSSDELYSKCSRWASDAGGVVERMWGSAMMQGDANALRMAALTAAHLQPLLLAFPKDVPLITTHQTVALTASACGFANVCNLVVDNHPQWFLTVPNALNLVQGPVNHQSFLQMGISGDELAWAGHWCPYDLVSNIEKDCRHRIERRQGASSSSASSAASAAPAVPLRLLVPVGGAGAQRKFILGLVKALSPLVRSGKVQLLLNAGDHAHMKTAFLQVLDELGLEFDTVADSPSVAAFQRKYLLENRNAVIPKGVTLFCFDEYFPAVATTDLLCRVADVLVCKPSELAFYCVPKLHIRRVGDHEADSAKRSSELGDGTVEAREIHDAVRFCHLFETTELLAEMNRAIIGNDRIGIYNGCQKAVELALERSKSK
jgi:hypothetical protein